MKTLIIAEKPNVACKIGALGSSIFGEFTLNGKKLTPKEIETNEKAINAAISRAGKLENDKYIIMFAAGHLVELYQAVDYDPKFKNWSNIPNGYVPSPFKLKIKDSAKSLYNNLSKVMNSNEVKEIIIATDADREGQTIFEWIYSVSKCNKPCKRIWINSFNEEAIKEAYQKIKNNKEYTGLKNAGYGRSTSDWLMGALLTAKTTLALSGGKEILNVGRVQTAVLAEIVRVENLIKNFSKQKSYQLVGTFKTENGEIFEGTYDEKFEDLQKATRTLEKLKGKQANINEHLVTEEKKWCPPLFNQTALQKEMSTKYDMSPDKTLSICQSLYEKGFLTYPRTSSSYIQEGEAETFGKMLNAINKFNPLSTKHKFSKTNKRIVDDSKVESHSGLTPTISLPNLSNLSVDERNVYNEVMLRVIALNFPAAIDEKQFIGTNINGILFKSFGKKELSRGFREVYNSEIKDTSLPVVSKGKVVEVVKITTKEIESKPPKRYTKATILGFMETCGKKIENEQALELMKNKGIGTAATRAEIVKKLMSGAYVVEKGKSLIPTEKGTNLIEKFPVDEMKNPEFTGDLEYRLYQVEKNEITLEEYMKYIEEVYKIACDKLSNSTSKVVTESDTSLGKCPSCNNGVVEHRKGSKNGKSYDFYGCTNWKGGCKFTINGVILTKKITEKQVKTLIEKGETSPIKGFISKAGKELTSAKLVIKKVDGVCKVDIDWN